MFINSHILETAGASFVGVVVECTSQNRHPEYSCVLCVPIVECSVRAWAFSPPIAALCGIVE